MKHGLSDPGATPLPPPSLPPPPHCDHTSCHPTTVLVGLPWSRFLDTSRTHLHPLGFSAATFVPRKMNEAGQIPARWYRNLCHHPLASIIGFRSSGSPAVSVSAADPNMDVSGEALPALDSREGTVPQRARPIPLDLRLGNQPLYHRVNLRR